MEKRKTRVFLTGATGVMGMAGLKELTNYPEKYEITVLARESKKNRQKLKPFKSKGIRIIWGDLLEEKRLRAGIEQADIVLHVGGMVSPLAEHYPEQTLKVNVGSMRLIAGIVRNIENKYEDRTIKVVYIGSVSQYGSKMPPNHWGKATDRLQPAKFDAYSESKILAEKALINAGIKKWVSIRQTSILHAGLLKNASNPVAFHTPVNGVLEWITTEDSGRLLERVCRDTVPDDFWCKYYNAGGGEPFRLTNLEFERGLLKAMGCPPPEKIFEPNWFCSDNFHGMWFEDSDDLDAILHFRGKDTFESALERIRASLPFYYRLAPIVPAVLIKKFMKRVAEKDGQGPLSWIRNNDEQRIQASWGSLENYANIPDWSNFKEVKLNKATPKVIKND